MALAMPQWKAKAGPYDLSQQTGDCTSNRWILLVLKVSWSNSQYYCEIILCLSVNIQRCFSSEQRCHQKQEVEHCEQSLIWTKPVIIWTMWSCFSFILLVNTCWFYHVVYKTFSKPRTNILIRQRPRLTSLHSFVPMPCMYNTTTVKRRETEREKMRLKSSKWNKKWNARAN